MILISIVFTLIYYTFRQLQSLCCPLFAICLQIVILCPLYSINWTDCDLAMFEFISLVIMKTSVCILRFLQYASWKQIDGFRYHASPLSKYLIVMTKLKCLKLKRLGTTGSSSMRSSEWVDQPQLYQEECRRKAIFSINILFMTADINHRNYFFSGIDQICVAAHNQSL